MEGAGGEGRWWGGLVDVSGKGGGRGYSALSNWLSADILGIYVLHLNVGVLKNE